MPSGEADRFPLVRAVPWLQVPYVRKLRLRIGEIEAEGQTKEEVEGLLAVAEQYQERRIGSARDAVPVDHGSSNA
jgi:hypothetical protein